MAKYSELQENEIQEIVLKYGLELINFEPIEEGAGNSSYMLRTRHREYVLTVFEIAMSRVSNLGKLLLLLEEQEFPATRPLHLATGGMTTNYQGKPLLVKTYIPGQVVKNLEKDMLIQVGAAMARLHAIPAPDFLPDIHAYGLQTFPKVLGLNIDPEYEAWLTQQYTFLVEHIPPGLPRGLIHGDLFYDNVLFDGKEIKAIIDFEETCQYYKVFDLGMGIVGLCAEDTSINLKKVQALLKGYQQMRVLEEREKNYLQLFVEYAATATSSWRFWKYNIEISIAEKADSHLHMASIAKYVHVIPKESFLEAVIY